MHAPRTRRRFQPAFDTLQARIAPAGIYFPPPDYPVPGSESIRDPEPEPTGGCLEPTGPTTTC